MSILIGLFLIFAMTQLITFTFRGSFSTWKFWKKYPHLVRWRSIWGAFIAWPVALFGMLIDSRDAYREWEKLVVLAVWIGFGFNAVWLMMGHNHPYLTLGTFLVGTAVWYLVGFSHLFMKRGILPWLRDELIFEEDRELWCQLHREKISPEEFQAKRVELARKWEGIRFGKA